MAKYNKIFIRKIFAKLYLNLCVKQDKGSSAFVNVNQNLFFKMITLVIIVGISFSIAFKPWFMIGALLALALFIYTEKQ